MYFACIFPLHVAITGASRHYMHACPCLESRIAIFFFLSFFFFFFFFSVWVSVFFFGFFFFGGGGGGGGGHTITAWNLKFLCIYVHKCML